MQFIYNIFSHLLVFGVWCAQWFSPKMKLFVAGRKKTFQILKKELDASKKTMWFHCASLGEYEQGVPIMQKLKEAYPKYQLLVTFFSPSGYEHKKNDILADVVVYLPLDTNKNATRFLETTKPDIVFFVKYEFWPNYLKQLKERKIPTYLISGVFRKNQLFFSKYGSFMRKALNAFDFMFLQDKESLSLLNSINFTNITVSGDTRFDRVAHQIEVDNTIPIVAKFKQNRVCIVCGSTWPEDEKVLLNSINKAPSKVCFIVAPHNINASKIENFRKAITKKSVLYSEVTQNHHTKADTLEEATVFIIDTIGLLKKIYLYADIAYIGGAMGSTGLHNILEAATFGVPIVIGKNYDEFPEAIKLQSLAGLYSIKNESECSAIFKKLVENTTFREKTGMIAGHYVNTNTGATKTILTYLSENKMLH